MVECAGYHLSPDSTTYIHSASNIQLNIGIYISQLGIHYYVVNKWINCSIGYYLYQILVSHTEYLIYTEYLISMSFNLEIFSLMAHFGGFISFRTRSLFTLDKSQRLILHILNTSSLPIGFRDRLVPAEIDNVFDMVSQKWP